MVRLLPPTLKSLRFKGNSPSKDNHLLSQQLLNGKEISFVISLIVVTKYKQVLLIVLVVILVEVK